MHHIGTQGLNAHARRAIWMTGRSIVKRRVCPPAVVITTASGSIDRTTPAGRRSPGWTIRPSTRAIRLRLENKILPTTGSGVTVAADSAAVAAPWPCGIADVSRRLSGADRKEHTSELQSLAYLVC